MIKEAEFAQDDKEQLLDALNEICDYFRARGIFIALFIGNEPEITVSVGVDADDLRALRNRMGL